jgi:dihydrodipicolinate synthase/N-acetylneuraminate lyase
MGLSFTELKSSLRGLIGFGVTPFQQDLTIDKESLRRNAAHLAKYCDIVVALGNNGEIFSLSLEEQKLVGRRVVEEVGKRKPVLVGTGFSLPDSCELAQAAEAYGADGILILPPHYSKSNEDGLFAYYQAVAQATKLGVILFQTPELNFSLSLLRRLAAIPNIVGLKDEHGDMKQFVRQQAAAGDRFTMLCGVGEILMPSYAALGIKGFTSGIVNFMPETTLQIIKLIGNGQFEEATKIVNRDTLPIFDLRMKQPGYSTSVIKEAMNLCGEKVGPVRPPLPALLESDREHLRTVLQDHGVLK